MKNGGKFLTVLVGLLFLFSMAVVLSGENGYSKKHKEKTSLTEKKAHGNGPGYHGGAVAETSATEIRTISGVTASPIDWGLEGVVKGHGLPSILQLTPNGDIGQYEDMVPCWGARPWSPDGKWIVFSSANTDDDNIKDLYKIRPDGTGLTRLTDSPDNCDSHASFTPDGTRIVWQFENDDGCAEIWIMDADGNNQVNLTEVHDGSDEGKPMVSPDGTKIAFYISGGVYVMDIDGTDRVLLSEDLGSAKKHSWSPDSQWVLFDARGDDDSLRIFKVRPDGTEEPTMLSEDSPEKDCENWAYWSPDGNWIAYHSTYYDDDDKFWYTLSIMRPDGTEKEILVQESEDVATDTEWGHVCGPKSWSPDSQYIAFKKLNSGSNISSIFTINIETREVQQLTTGYADRTLWWNPVDANQILFRETGSLTRDNQENDDDLLVLNLDASDGGGGGGGSLPVGPLAAGISALLSWWKRRKQE